MIVSDKDDSEEKTTINTRGVQADGEVVVASCLRCDHCFRWGVLFLSLIVVQVLFERYSFLEVVVASFQLVAGIVSVVMAVETFFEVGGWPIVDEQVLVMTAFRFVLDGRTDLRKN